jgi:uncharacterized RDD family membrane protein YckC
MSEENAATISDQAAAGEPPRDVGRYAGFWLRAVALLIDGLITGVASFILSFVIGFAIGFSNAAAGGDPAVAQFVSGLIGQAISFLRAWLYFALMKSSSLQATLGKKAMGLKVVDTNGERISFGRATGRYFAKILSFLILLIGYFMAGWTKRKQALHDMVAGTLVVRA